MEYVLVVGEKSHYKVNTAELPTILAVINLAHLSLNNCFDQMAAMHNKICY